MKKLTLEELNQLVRTDDGLCASIFLPTYRYGPEVRHNKSRFQKLLDSAGESLRAGGLKAPVIDQILEPARQLLQDSSFMEHPLKGLAVFLSPKLFRHYLVPIAVREQIVVGKQFFIKPLLTMVDHETKYYLLAASEKRVKLLEGSESGLSEVQVQGMPNSLREAMRFNDPERQLQYHTQTPRIPGSRAGAIFHGHGVGIDDEKDDLLEFCRQIDRALHVILKNEKAPLILASVSSFFPIYGKMNTYSCLLEDGIPGNPEFVSTAELHGRAWKLAVPHFEKQKKNALRKYAELAGTDLSSNNVEDILAAASSGRILNLFVNDEEDWWARYDADTERVESHDTYQPKDEEMINLAVSRAMATGANVYSIQPVMAEYPGLFAVYRF